MVLVGRVNSRMTARPPGRRTRRISRSPASSDWKLRTPKAQDTMEKLSSAKGRRRASASIREELDRPAARSSISWAKSQPVTDRAPPRRKARAKSPVPQATSSTSSSGRTPASWTAWRRQDASRPALNTVLTNSYRGAMALNMARTREALSAASCGDARRSSVQAGRSVMGGIVTEERDGRRRRKVAVAADRNRSAT